MFQGQPSSTGNWTLCQKTGAKAQKRGISSEYICINTGVTRDGEAIAETVNKAKPDCSELWEVYNGHLQDGNLFIGQMQEAYISKRPNEYSDKKMLNKKVTNWFYSYFCKNVEDKVIVNRELIRKCSCKLKPAELNRLTEKLKQAESELENIQKQMAEHVKWGN